MIHVVAVSSPMPWQHVWAANLMAVAVALWCVRALIDRMFPAPFSAEGEDA